jgi:hypothetical protein
MAYSWGFEVLMAWIFRIGGLASIPLTLVVLRAAVLLAVFLMLARISNRFWASWLLTAVAAFPLTSVMVIRPGMFTLLFFTLELAIIFEARKRGSAKPLYWMPLLFLAWSNIHIQFVYGLAVFALFIGCELLTRLAGTKWQIPARPVETPTLRLLLLFLLSFLATVIGPYWGKVYLVILNLATNVSQYNSIGDLVALSFRQVSDYFVVILLMGACFALGRKKLDLFAGLLLFGSAMTSFRSNRDQWFVCLAACALIAEAVAGEKEKVLGWFSPAWQYATVFVISVALAAGYAFDVGLTPQNLIGGIDLVYPVRATEFIRDQHLPGPMYNTFDWGGFLIFNLREYPVSVDGRTDLYTIEQQVRSNRTADGFQWESDPDLEKAGFVLLPKSQGLARALAGSAKYKAVYADHIAVVFVKQDTK